MADQPQGWTVNAGAGGFLAAPPGSLVGSGVSDLSSDRGGAFLGGGAGPLVGPAAAGGGEGPSGSRLLGPFGQDTSSGLGQSFATRDASIVFSGDASLKYTFADGGTGLEWQGIATNDPVKGGFCLPLRPGAAYRITTATRVSSVAAAPRLRLRVAFNALETIQLALDVAFNLANTWEVREWAVTVPSTADPNAKLYVEFQRGSGVTKDFWVDSVRFEENAIVSTAAGQATTGSIKETSIMRQLVGPTLAQDMAACTSRSRLQNGGFQDGLIWWNSNPTSIPIVANNDADTYKGTFSCKIPHTGAAQEYIFQSNEPREPVLSDAHPANWVMFAVRPSRGIQVDYSCKVSGAGVIGRVYVAEYSASGGLLGVTQIGTDVTSTTWVDRSAEFVVSATTFWVVARFAAEGASSGTVWYDELYFTDLVPANDLSMPLDALTVNDNITILGTAGHPNLEIGRVDGSASTPYIDFHSGATPVDYDARLIASGGTGVAGGGKLTASAAIFEILKQCDMLDDTLGLAIGTTFSRIFFNASGSHRPWKLAAQDAVSETLSVYRAQANNADARAAAYDEVLRMNASTLRSRLGQSTSLGPVPGVGDIFGVSATSATGFASIMNFTIPANAFSTDGDSIRVTATGSTFTQIGQLRCRVDGAVVATSGNIAAGHVFCVETIVTRTSSTAYAGMWIWHSGATTAALTLNFLTRFSGSVANWTALRIVEYDGQTNVAGGSIQGDEGFSVLHLQ